MKMFSRLDADKKNIYNKIRGSAKCKTKHENFSAIWLMWCNSTLHCWIVVVKLAQSLHNHNKKQKKNVA